MSGFANMESTLTYPSKVIGIQFSMMSPEDIRKSSVVEITRKDTYNNNNRPTPNGMFDIRMGVLEPGMICPTDGHNYMKTPGYFGHIELARPVFYIQYFDQIIKTLRCVCFKCSKLLINKNYHREAMEMMPQDRASYVFNLCNEIKVCGSENPDGCGCVQPTRFKKEGFATIYAEWSSKATTDKGADNEKGGNDANATAAPSENITIKVTPEMVIKLFSRISDEDVAFMGYNPVFSRPEWMVCQVLAVPPPAVRPSVKHDAHQRSEDDISHILVNIFKMNEKLQEKIKNNAKENIIENMTLVLQYYVATMVNNKIPGVASVAQRTGRPLKSIMERMKGKYGRVRGNLMGKRVDFSSRSVITADPNLSIRQLGVPLEIAMNITYPVKVNTRNRKFLLRLVQNGPDKHPGAKILERANGDSISLRYVDKSTLTLNIGDTVHRHMLDGDPVLFNRQPSLHKMSMMCHIAKIMKEGKTFRMNVADTKPYNADFDGDEMNMHMPQDDESTAELRYLAAVPRQIVSPATNSSLIGIFQDSLLGAYRITRADVKFDTRAAMNLLMSYPKVDKSLFSDPDRMISTFEVISQIMPPMTAVYKNSSYGDDEDSKTSNNIVEIVNGKMKRGQFDKKIKNLLHGIFNDYGFNASSDFIDNIQNIVTEYMKLSAFSVGISDLLADRETNNKIADAITKKKQEVKDLIDQVRIGVFENNTGKSNYEEFETTVNGILNKAQEEAGKIGRKSLSEFNRFKIMVNAGSKGSNINIAQMISCLGQQNVDGKRIPYGFEDRTLPHYTKFDDSPEARGFVSSSFIQGLTPQELFFHAMGGRVGLIDTAVKTAKTGYIQRRLIKSMEDLKVEYDMTVRNHLGKIIQFTYGEDSIDPSRIEDQRIPIVKMNMEDIYNHYHTANMSIDDKTLRQMVAENMGNVRLDDDITSMMKMIYTTDTYRRLSGQEEELNKRVQMSISRMLKARNILVEKVFGYKNDSSVKVPVHFQRIITNIKNQLGINHYSTSDMTPLECYQIIDDYRDRLMKIQYAQPNDLFFVMYEYYLSPKQLILVHRFNKNAMIVLMNTIMLNYKKAIIAPGEMVGIVAAQSIGEPTTQMTLNTFHFAGVSSKSNVTRGVPRIEEILSLSKKPKNPSLTVMLKKEDRQDKQRVQQLSHFMEHTPLRDLVTSVSIYYERDDIDSLKEEDRTMISQFREFEQLMKGCAGYTEKDETSKNGDVYSKWVLRLEMDKETMLDRNITMDDVNFAIHSSYQAEFDCVFSDYNSDNLVFRIRIMDKGSQKSTKSNLLDSKQKSLDQSDKLYMLQNLQDYLLDNVVLRGVTGLKKVIMRKIQGYMEPTNDGYKPTDIWVLDTVGTNLMSVLAMDEIDSTSTTSNDIIEVMKVLGVEAARQTIYNEMIDVIEFGGGYVNSHHLSMLCDRMACNEDLVAVSRHGVNNDNIGPIAKASFEETPIMFLKAAVHGEMDPMRGVSANVMTGQRGYFGTSSFNVVLDMDAMMKQGDKMLEKRKTIEEQLEMDDPNDMCAIGNIQQDTTIHMIQGMNMNADDGMLDDNYDFGF